MLYFAYGSNMDAGRMRGRSINFSSRRPARLIGYSLTFNKKASNGDFSYANIIPHPGDIVEGALYEFPENEIIALDGYEGYPDQYNRIILPVIDQNNNIIDSTVYIAVNTAPGYLPKREYLEHLLAGKDLLSKTYFEKLKQVKTL